MNNEPLVSVIINCYNGESFVRDSISSVIKQNYKNWEIIFWDNRSSDNTYKEVISFSDKRIKYFLAEKHTTLYKARNYAIKKAKGDFYAFLDVDDWWEVDKLKKQVPLFQNQNIGLVYSNFYKCDEIKRKTFINHKKILPSGNVTNLLLKNYNIGWLTVVIRRSFYEKLQSKFNPKYNVIGDFDLIIRLSTICEILYLNEVTGYCRWHGGNLQIEQEKKHLKELNHWVTEMENFQSISNLSNFSYFRNNLIKMNVMYSAKNDISGFRIIDFIKVKGIFNKIKILLILFLPKKILKFL